MVSRSLGNCLWFVGPVFVLLVVWAGSTFINQPVELNLAAATGGVLAVVALVIIYAIVLYNRVSKDTAPWTQIQKPSVFNRCLRFMVVPSSVAGGLLFGIYVIALSVEDLVSFRTDRDIVVISQLDDVGAKVPRDISIEPEPNILEVHLNVIVRSGSPFQFRMCRSNNFRQISGPKSVELFQVVKGQFIRVDAAFNDRRGWRSHGSKNCLDNALQLKAQIEGSEHYCVDLHFSGLGDAHSERTCWKFTRELSEDVVTLREILRR